MPDNGSSKGPYIIFAMQAAITLVTIGFSIYMMVRSSDNIQIFLPIMSSVSAYWLPSPRIPIGGTSPPDFETGLPESTQKPRSSPLPSPHNHATPPLITLESAEVATRS